jgi:hypothetical protein
MKIATPRKRGRRPASDLAKMDARLTSRKQLDMAKLTCNYKFRRSISKDS